MTQKYQCQFPIRWWEQCGQPATRFYPKAARSLGVFNGRQQMTYACRWHVCEGHAPNLSTRNAPTMKAARYPVDLTQRGGHTRKWLTLQEYEIWVAEEKLSK